MNKPFEYYKDYLGFIENAVVEILIHDRMFSETAEIVKKNSKINTSNSFFNWLMSAYISDITIRIRRLVDKRKDVQSLVKFLEEVKKDQVVRSRKHHVDFYKTDPFLTEIGEAAFDKLAGKNAIEYSKGQVQTDIETLLSASESIVDYANNFIAHSKANVKKETTKRIATFEDVRKAIKTFDQIVIKYFLLIRASGKGDSLMPTWQYDWKAIFKIPWLESS